MGKKLSNYGDVINTIVLNRLIPSKTWNLFVCLTGD